MDKKTLFMKAVLGVGLAGVITFGATACTTDSTSECRRELAAEMSVDAKRTFFDVYSFRLGADDNGYYINFKGHYATDGTGKKYNPYTDHQDYEITYQIKKEQYLEISKQCAQGQLLTDDYTKDTINLFIKIVKEHDPISVIELETDDFSCK